jgi:GNAT superfamily N-acetyltransferase
MVSPRRFRREDARPLAEVLARAFRDNPLNRAVIGGAPRRRLRANRAGMRATLAAARPPCRILVAAGDGEPPVGGLIAMPPGAWPLGPPPLWDQLRVLIGQGIATARRWGRVFDALQSVHPVAPHFYLALVGVAPDHQGRGIGAALVAHWLQEVDALQTSAFLETDRPELLGFYGRFGFSPVESTELFGVPVHLLWRPTVPGPGG